MKSRISRRRAAVDICTAKLSKLTNHKKCKLTKLKIKFIEFVSFYEADNYQSLNFLKTNVIITTPYYFTAIKSLNLDFSRIIFDDTELDMNYENIKTDFTWVITANMKDIDSNLVIRCSQDFINHVYIFTEVFNHTFVCEYTYNIQETDYNLRTMLYEDDFDKYIKLTEFKDETTNLIRLRNSLNIYSGKLEKAIDIIKDKDLTILFIKNNHEYIKNILYTQYDIKSDILFGDNYELIDKFNKKEIQVLLINPDYKGVGIINTKHIIIYDELDVYEVENCVGRVLRKSRNKSLRLDIYKLFY